jgi:flagellar export protein FliJ
MRGFRLVTVERLRGQELEASGRQLHAATATLTAAVVHRDDLAAELNNPNGGVGLGLTTGAGLELAANYRQLLREEIVLEGRQIAELQRNLEQARIDWLASRSKLRAVQALHERHRTTLRLADTRREQRELDELASTRATNPTKGVTP